LAPSSQCATSAAPDSKPNAPRRQPTNVGALSFVARQPVPQNKNTSPIHITSSTKQKQAQILHPENVDGHVTSHAPEAKLRIRYISPCVSYNWFMFAGPFKSHTCISGSHLPFQQSPPQFFQPFSSLPYPLSFRGFSSQNTMTRTRRSQPTFQPVLGSQHGPSHISDPRSPGITENRVNPATGLWVGIANLHKAP
jgi:hypothetical protein